MPPLKLEYIKVPKGAEYNKADDLLVNDHRLSWGCKGLGHYLLTHPDGYIFKVSDIYTIHPTGQRRINEYITNLVFYGYIVEG
jgi:hypothetical protein